MFASIIPILAVCIFLFFLSLMFFLKKDRNKIYIQYILLAYPLIATYILPGGIGINNFDFISWVFFLFFYKRKETSIQLGKFYLFLFLVIISVSIVGCVLAAKLTTESLRYFIEFFAIFIFSKVIIEECISDPSFFYTVIGCVRSTVLFALIFLACQFIFGIQFNINRELNVNVFQDAILRYPGFFQDPQKFGQFLGVSSFLFLIKKPDEEKIPVKNYILLVLTLIALLYTGGRAASSGWVLGFSLIVLFGNSKLKLYSIILAIIMFFIVINFKDNFAVFNRGDNLSDSYDWRHSIWEEAVDISSDNFFFGIAPGNYTNYISVHNPNQSFIVDNEVYYYAQPESGYLKWLCEFGIFGFISILLLIITPLITSFISFLKSRDTTYLLLISPLICWMVSYYTVYSVGDIRIQILITTITCLSISHYKKNIDIENQESI